MRFHRLSFGVLSMAAVFIAIGGIGTAGSVSAAEPRVQKVEIEKSAFVPKETTIAPGTRVVWTNHDEMPHTVTGRDKTFASKGLDTDDKFEYVFEREGDFEYHCTVHPYMTGVVHVRR